MHFIFQLIAVRNNNSMDLNILTLYPVIFLSSVRKFYEFPDKFLGIFYLSEQYLGTVTTYFLELNTLGFVN